MIAVPSLGLAGIWIGLIVWMTLRAVFNALPGGAGPAPDVVAHAEKC